MTLIILLERADSINKSIPFFDDISYGLPRLMVAGLAGSDGRRFWATPAGSGLVTATHKAQRRDDFILTSLVERIGLPPWPLPEPEKRSLGRLAGLTRERYDHAYAAYLRTSNETFPQLVAWTVKWGFRTLAQQLIRRGRPRGRQGQDTT